jgi:hypothetical protein
MDYWEGINQGDDYMCDRCNVAKLSEYEYEGNHNPDNGNRYCTECANWIILKHYKCESCGVSGSHRSERILPMNCQCGETLCLK